MNVNARHLGESAHASSHAATVAGWRTFRSKSQPKTDSPALSVQSRLGGGLRTAFRMRRMASWTSGEKGRARSVTVTFACAHAESAAHVAAPSVAAAPTRQLVAAAAKGWATAGPLQLEAAFCLRALLEHLKRGGGGAADELEGAAPELMDFCDALQRAITACDAAVGAAAAVHANFVLSQLLPLVAARKASSMLTESLDAQLPLS